MKIRIAFTPEEEAKAAEVVRILRALLPVKVKETPETDGYIHVYISTLGRK